MPERCNYCTLQMLLAEALRTDCRVISKPTGWGPDGVPGTDLFIVPWTDKIGKYNAPTKTSPKGDKEFQGYCQKYKRVWMASIPYKCECNPEGQ